MKLTVKPTIADNRYSVVIKYKEYGSTNLTPAEEAKIVDDYSPKFKLSDIVFTGKYNIAEGKAVADEASGEDVSITLPNKEIKISELLEVGYTVHINEITSEEVKTILKDKDLVAQAKCQLFIDKVTDKVNSVLTSLGEKLNDFETEYEVEVG